MKPMFEVGGLGRQVRRWFVGAATTGLLLGSACQSASDESVTRDSNSNWLTACNDNDDCDPDSTCFNERCVSDCESDGDCSGNATCQSATVVDGCVSFGQGSKQCFTGCDTDGDCEALGNALSCVDGACVHQGNSCEEDLPSSGEPADAGPMSNPEPEGPGPSVEPSPEPEGPSSGPLPGPVPSGSFPAPSASVPTPFGPGPSPSETPVPSPSVPGEPEVSPSECPVTADTCPEGCFEVQARPIPPGLDCFGQPITLGCADPGIVTDDANCVRAADGTLYTQLSGSHSDQLIASGEYADCSADDWYKVETIPQESCDVPVSETCGTATCAAGERCCDSCQGFCASPNDDVACPDDSEPERTCAESEIVYSAQMTNGINCCDFYSVIRFDPEVGSCVIVEVRHQVGDEPEATSARAVVGVEDCWAALGPLEGDAGPNGAAATALGGVMSFDSPGVLSFDLEIEFADGPEGVPPVVTFRANGLTTNGEWYPEE
jgi:hypothetical protein